jgi:hypothetical protein
LNRLSIIADLDRTLSEVHSESSGNRSMVGEYGLKNHMQPISSSSSLALPPRALDRAVIEGQRIEIENR